MVQWRPTIGLVTTNDSFLTNYVFSKPSSVAWPNSTLMYPPSFNDTTLHTVAWNRNFTVPEYSMFLIPGSKHFFFFNSVDCALEIYVWMLLRVPWGLGNIWVPWPHHQNFWFTSSGLGPRQLACFGKFPGAVNVSELSSTSFLRRTILEGPFPLCSKLLHRVLIVSYPDNDKNTIGYFSHYPSTPIPSTILSCTILTSKNTILIKLFI